MPQHMKGVPLSFKIHHHLNRLDIWTQKLKYFYVTQILVRVKG